MGGDGRCQVSGKQIKLFLIDGTPGGVTTAEITNWTGHVLAAARSDLADLLKREETQRTGAYLLLGEDETAVGASMNSSSQMGLSVPMGASVTSRATWSFLHRRPPVRSRWVDRATGDGSGFPLTEPLLANGRAAASTKTPISGLGGPGFATRSGTPCRGRMSRCAVGRR